MNTKTKIYVLLLIWGAAILQFFVNRSINREEVLVEQVLSDGVESVKNSNIKAFALYGNEEISEETKEVIVTKIARLLGVYTGYEIVRSSEGDAATVVSRETRLLKEGEQGNTEISLFSVYKKDAYEQETVEQYLMVEVDLKKKASAAIIEVKKEVCAIYGELGMKPSINMHMTSQKKGKLSEENMQAEIDTFFDELNAKHVSYDEFYSTVFAYGYSKDIEDYVYQGKDKVNVQIAFSYDEKNDMTLMHTAVPFIDGAF